MAPRDYQLPPGATLYFEGRLGEAKQARALQPAVVSLLITMPVFLCFLAAAAFALAGPIGVAVYALIACIVGLGFAIAGSKTAIGKWAIGISIVAVLAAGGFTYLTVVTTTTISDCLSGNGC